MATRDPKWFRHPHFAELPWSYQQVREAVRATIKGTDGGWLWSTHRVREALVAERAFAIVRAQHAEKVAVVAMDRLLLAMRIDAGLYPDDDYQESAQ